MLDMPEGGKQMNGDTMGRIAGWGRFVGMTTMIIGGIYGVIGLFAFIVGAIPGGVMFFMGFLLFKMGTSAKRYLESGNERSIGELLDSLGSYILLQGVLLIIVLGLYLVMILFFIATLFMIMS